MLLLGMEYQYEQESKADPLINSYSRTVTIDSL